MEIKKQAVAGTVESSDIMVTVSPNPGGGVSLELDSSVAKQFGNQIKQVILETVNHLGVSEAHIEAVDQGALDCTIQARTIAAVYRAAQESQVNWKEIATWNA